MKELLIQPEDSITSALQAMSRAGEKCLIVVDPGDRAIGTLSDGDLRRALLQGKHLAESIEEIYFRSPTILEHGCYSEEDARRLFLKSNHHILEGIN